MYIIFGYKHWLGKHSYSCLEIGPCLKIECLRSSNCIRMKKHLRNKSSIIRFVSRRCFRELFLVFAYNCQTSVVGRMQGFIPFTIKKGRISRYTVEQQFGRPVYRKNKPYSGNINFGNFIDGVNMLCTVGNPNSDHWS